MLYGTSAHAATTNVRNAGAHGDGVTDDRAAIQSAIDNLQSQGGGTLFVPAGTYLLNSYRTADHGWFFYNLIIGSNITIQGETGSKFLQGPNGVAPLVNGATQVRNTVLAFGRHYTLITFQDINFNGGFRSIKPTKADDTTVKLTNLADKTRFAPGDYVMIYEYTTGDVLPSEFTQVLLVDGVTGVLTLKYPLTRGFATPSIANVNQTVTQNVAVKNLIVQGAEPLAATEVFGFTADNCQFISEMSVVPQNTHGLNLNTLRNATFSNSLINSINGPYMGVELPQRNSQNVTFINNTFELSSMGFGEYGAHWNISNNHIWLHPNPTTAVGFAFGGFDVNIENNDIHGDDVTVNGGALILDVYAGTEAYTSYTGKIRIVNNTVDCVADVDNYCIKLVGSDTVLSNNQIRSAGNNYAVMAESGLPQTVQILGNTMNLVNGATAIAISSSPPEGAIIRNNIISAQTPGAIGIYVASPPLPNAGTDVICGNTITGYSTPFYINQTSHPGAIFGEACNSYDPIAPAQPTGLRIVQ